MPQFVRDECVPAAEFSCVTAAEFRNALSNVATSVSVITTDGPAGAAGVTCSVGPDPSGAIERAEDGVRAYWRRERSAK